MKQKIQGIMQKSSLVALGIIQNTSDKKWGAIYSYVGYTALLAPAVDL